MAFSAIVIGSLLIIEGLGFYIGLTSPDGERPSLTAMIPAFFGLPILLFGLLALKEKMRMHAMHGVVLIALIGFILATGRLMMTVATGGELKMTSGASLGLMALLCGMLSGLCVKSFIDARRRRLAEQSNESTGQEA